MTQLNASQKSSASSSSQKGEKHPLLCYHNEVAPLRTVKVSSPTYGRHFYGCNYWPLTCGFFKWEGEVNDLREWQWRIFEKDTNISELEHANDLLEAKMKLLVQERDKLFLDFCKARTTVGAKCMELEHCVSTKNKYLVALLGCWIICCIFMYYRVF